MPVMYLDESEHGDFLSVGGYYCSTGDVPRIEASWRALKQELGLEPTAPLKWSPQGAVQQTLKGGVGTDEARRRAAAVIAGLPLEIVVVVLQERRGRYLVLGCGQADVVERDVADWKSIFPAGGGVRHFYLRGVEFALQRFADRLQPSRQGTPGHSHLVLDDLHWASSPGKMTKKLKTKLDAMPETDSWVIRDWMNRGVGALYDAYARWYELGFAAPYDQLGSLRSVGCESTFHQTHDDRSQAMQVADFVAGATGAFVSELTRGKPGIGRECVRAFRPRVRSTGTIGYGMWGNGFVLWPPNPDLWNEAKAALA